MVTSIGAPSGNLNYANGADAPPPGADDTPELGPADDAMAKMYLAVADSQSSSLASGQAQVQQNTEALRKARAEEQAAMDQARANQADSGGGFFGAIADFVGDVVGDVVHGKFGQAVDDAARDISAAWNSPKFWNDLERGMTMVATVGAAAAKIPNPVAVTIGAAVNMNATVIAGVAHIRTSEFAADAQDATADAQTATGRVDQVSREQDDVVDTVRNTCGIQTRTLATIAGAIETNDQTTAIAASTRVKG